MRASNVIYEVDEGRPFWKLRPLQVVVTLAMVLLAALTSLALVLSGPLATSVGDAVGLSDSVVDLYQLAKWPVLVLVLLAMTSLLYYAAPNVRRARHPLGHARQPAGPRRSGWWRRRCSPSTWATSAPTTRPTAPSAG